MISRWWPVQFALGQVLLITIVVAMVLGIVRWIWPLTPVMAWLGITLGSLLYTVALIGYARGASVRWTIVLLLIGAGSFVYAALQMLSFWQNWLP